MKLKKKEKNKGVSHLSLYSFNNIIQININEHISFETFFNELKAILSEEELKFIQINQLNNKVISGKFIIVKGVRKSFNILINDEYNFFAKNICHLDGSRLVTFLSVKQYDYEVTEKISNDKKKMFRRYNNSYITQNTFPKKEAIDIAIKILEDLRGIKEVLDYIDFYLLYKNLNVVRKDFIFPVCSDGIITLAEKCNPGFLYFEIILNETNEKLGFISWNAMKEGFSYDGDVSCEINSIYRNNGYATRALKLLLDNLAKRKINEVYVASKLNNFASQKVIEKNDGKLLLKGYLVDEKTKKLHNIEEVMVYKLTPKK